MKMTMESIGFEVFIQKYGLNPNTPAGLDLLENRAKEKFAILQLESDTRLVVFWYGDAGTNIFRVIEDDKEKIYYGEDPDFDVDEFYERRRNITS